MSCGGLGSYMSETPLKAGDVLFSETTTETVTRTVHRQATIEGRKVDLRNGRNHMILTANIEDLLDLAPVWLTMLETKTDPRARSAIEITLQCLIAYRGRELPENLRQIILSTLKGELHTPSKWVSTHTLTSPLSKSNPPTHTESGR